MKKGKVKGEEEG